MLRAAIQKSLKTIGGHKMTDVESLSAVSLYAESGNRALIPLSADAEQLCQRAIAPATVLAYSRAWRNFVAWCGGQGYPFLPTQSNVIVNYLSTIPIEKSYSHVMIVVAAIRFKHSWHDTAIQGSQRAITTALDAFRKSQPRIVHKAAEIDLPLLEKVVSELPDTIEGLRNRVAFLLSFYCGFRRSEVVSLKCEHLKMLSDGNLEIVLLQSKTSDVPVTLHVARNPDSADGLLCPVQAVETWMREARISEGPLIRPMIGTRRTQPKHLSPQCFNVLTKKHFGPKYSGHSFRRGLATAMNDCKISVAEIATRLRHRDTKTTYGYIETATGIAAAEDLQQAFARKRKE
jgi:integrase